MLPELYKRPFLDINKDVYAQFCLVTGTLNVSVMEKSSLAVRGESAEAS